MPASIPLHRLCRRLTGLLLASLCAGAGAQSEATYTVQPGDHPWSIAQRYLLRPAMAAALARHNGIRNDRRIAPGTVLRIPAPWLRQQSARARLATLHGDVQLVDAAGGSRAAVQGEVWEPGTSLRTGVQSTARLEFEDGTQALVRQLSHIRLLQAQRPVLGSGHQVQLDLVRGAIENLVRPVTGPGARFEIRTPAAVAAVRCTQFRVQAEETQTRTEVLEGAVLVRNDRGEAAAAAGSGTVATAGAVPQAPTPLPAAPDLSGLPARLERLPVDWPIPAVAGGVAYRTQVAPDDGFALLLSDELTGAPRIRILAAPDGAQVLRVRTADAQGLEGPSAERRIEIFTQPAAPFLIEPARDAQTLSAQPEFRWTQVGPTLHYRLQIFAADAPDTQPLEDQTVAGTTAARPQRPLPPGLYRWRVASIDPERQRQGPWGDSQGLRRVAPGPDLPPPEAQDGRMVLQWPVQAHAARYDVQVASDAAFASLLAEDSTTTAAYRFQRPAPGSYQVRVRAVGADGFVGPWGAPQGFTIPVPVPEPEPPARDWRPWLLLVPLLLLAL